MLHRETQIRHHGCSLPWGFIGRLMLPRSISPTFLCPRMMRDLEDTTGSVIPEAHRIWLERAYEKHGAGKPVDASTLHLELRDVLPEDFRPSDVDARFYNGQVTLRGVWLVEPRSEALVQIEQIIFEVQRWLFQNPALRAFTADEVPRQRTSIRNAWPTPLRSSMSWGVSGPGGVGRRLPEASPRSRWLRNRPYWSTSASGVWKSTSALCSSSSTEQGGERAWRELAFPCYQRPPPSAIPPSS